LAGVGAGVWDSVEEACDSVIRVVDTTEPIPENVELYNRYWQIYRALYQSVKKHYDEIAQISQ